MNGSSPRLKGRAAAVFESYFGGRAHQLHPEDREAAEAFWTSLGELDAPDAPFTLPERPMRSRVLAMASLAAMIVVLACGGWLVSGHFRNGPEFYHTKRGQTSTLALDDGSSVRLGADSLVQVAYEAGVRRVILESGDAIFEVAKDPARPFIVETPSGEVKALGTTFMVRLLPDQARLTVIEGTVKVTPDPDTTGAAPISRIATTGEQVEFGVVEPREGASRQAFVGNVEPVDIPRATGWTRGMLYFRGESLSEAISVANRYAEHPLRMPEPAAADIPVFAAIRVGDTSALSAILEDPTGSGENTSPPKRAADQRD